jgi:hypothetical protein
MAHKVKLWSRKRSDGWNENPFCAQKHVHIDVHVHVDVHVDVDVAVDGFCLIAN